MSAYVCNPEHFAAMANFAYGVPNSDIIYEWRAGDGRKDAIKECAAQLAKENIRSVKALYGDDDKYLPGPTLHPEDIIKNAVRIADQYYLYPPRLRPIDVLSMCSCYETQSCETDDWQQTLAYRQIQWIVAKAHRKLPGYGDSIRDFEDLTLTEYTTTKKA